MLKHLLTLFTLGFVLLASAHLSAQTLEKSCDFDQKVLSVLSQAKVKPEVYSGVGVTGTLDQIHLVYLLVYPRGQWFIFTESFEESSSYVTPSSRRLRVQCLLARGSSWHFYSLISIPEREPKRGVAGAGIAITKNTLYLYRSGVDTWAFGTIDAKGNINELYAGSGWRRAAFPIPLSDQSL